MRASSACVGLAVLLVFGSVWGNAAPAAAPSAAAASPAAKTIKVGSGAPTFSFVVPQLIGSQQLARKYGYEIDYRGAGTSSVNLVAGVLGGDFDVAFAAATSTAAAIQEGAQIGIIAHVLRTSSFVAVRSEVAKKLGVAPEAPIEQRVRALKGLTIVTSGAGSGNNNALRLMLREYGLDPEREVKIVGSNENSSQVDGLRRGLYDAGMNGGGVFESNFADNSAVLWISVARGDVPIFRDSLGIVGIARLDKIRQRPDMVEAIYRAAVDAIDGIYKDAEATGRFLKEKSFRALDQRLFDIGWKQMQAGAYPKGAAVSRKALELTVAQDALLTKKSYDKVLYDKVVFGPAKTD